MYKQGMLYAVFVQVVYTDICAIIVYIYYIYMYYYCTDACNIIHIYIYIYIMASKKKRCKILTNETGRVPR